MAAPPPGVCAIRDDYEAILRSLLRYDTAILISGTALGFIGHRTKNIVDRTLPLATMYTHVVDGQMRHVPRYNKRFCPIPKCLLTVIARRLGCKTRLDARPLLEKKEITN